MEEAIQIIAVLSFFLIGFSLIFQPKVWLIFLFTFEKGAKLELL